MSHASLEAAATILTARGEWPRVIECQRALAAVSNDEEQSRRLEEIGDIYLEHMEDPAEAAVAYQAALDVQPKKRGLLSKLLDLYSQQKEWARDFKHLWIGLATQYLFDEEREPLVRIREFADGRGTLEGAKQQFALISEHLRKFAPELHDRIRSFLDSPSASNSPARSISEFMAALPAGYLPESKLKRTVERVRAEGVEGVVLFSAGGIGSARLWDAVAELYGRE